MRFTDVILTIPLLLVAAVAGYALGATGVWSVAFVLGNQHRDHDVEPRSLRRCCKRA